MNNNSHFVFNSLNSIKNLVLQERLSEASDYLTIYAEFIRYQDSSRSKVYVLLAEEINNLLLFTELERLRYKRGFEFNCYLDQSVDQNSLWIPSRIIQPLVEELIWNSINVDRNDPAHLVLAISFENGILECIIRVNSLISLSDPRTSSPKRESILPDWLSKRIAIFNKWDEDHIQFNNIELIDSDNNESGMEIILKLPVRWGSETLEQHTKAGNERH